jgi:hypothetical protein
MGAAVVAALLAVGLVVPGSGLARSGRACSGIVAAGDPYGIYLEGSSLTARSLACRRGRRVVRAYLRAKLNPNEICAGQAETPPFRGCRIGRYRCRRTALGFKAGKAREDCSWGDRSVRFLELDADNG